MSWNQRRITRSSHNVPAQTEGNQSTLINYIFLPSILILSCFTRNCGPGSVVGITNGYGLDGPGIESPWGRDFPHLSRPALGPTQPPVQWVPVLSGGKERPGRDANPSPLLVPWSRKDRAIPLLPLWALQPVQSLSACTRVTFTFTFYEKFQAVASNLVFWNKIVYILSGCLSVRMLLDLFALTLCGEECVSWSS